MKNKIKNELEILFYLIQNHKDFMIQGILSTKRILDNTKNGALEDLARECENRQRLISIMEKIQRKIEQLIINNQAQLRDNQLKNGVLNWQKEYEAWIIDIDNLDQYILTLLTKEKDKTTQEIATVFKNRQSIQKYDLTNTKNK